MSIKNQDQSEKLSFQKKIDCFRADGNYDHCEQYLKLLAANIASATVKKHVHFCQILKEEL